MNKCMKCEIAFPYQSLWKNSVMKSTLTYLLNTLLEKKASLRFIKA